MRYTLDQITRSLKAARDGKGLSQRALAEQAGVPQSHISKIENAAVDLRLSSLVGIARALDLEVVLVPRKHVSAVRMIASSGEGAVRGQGHNASANELQELRRATSLLARDYPGLTELAQIQRRIRDLQQLALPPEATDGLRHALEALRAFERNTAERDLLEQALATLDGLRNSLAHAESAEPGDHRRRAYSLEDPARG